MINKFEAIGIFLSVAIMALALFLLRVETTSVANQINSSQSAAIALVDESVDGDEALYKTLADSVSLDGDVEKLVIDDVLVGTGNQVETGDTVEVNYIGTLQNGQQFDNSYERGQTFTFKVGDGKVIEGWDLGVVGMKVGGQRILVIPPQMAYGKQAVGPIPANSTLIFAIELVGINE